MVNVFCSGFSQFMFFDGICFCNMYLGVQCVDFALNKISGSRDIDLDCFKEGFEIRLSFFFLISVKIIFDFFFFMENIRGLKFEKY